MQLNEIILSNVGDALIEMPIEYSINGHMYYLYPPSLGSTILLNKTLSKSFEDKKDIVVEMLAICSFEDRAMARYPSVLKKRIEEIKQADIEELMPIYMMFGEWTQDQDTFVKHFHLDKEQKYMKRAHEAKDKNSGSLIFNGKSVYGTLIDVACERYGWSMEYVIWGISMLNLNMLMTDKVVNVFLTKDESRKAAIPQNREVLKIDKNTDIKQILAHLKR